MKIAYLAEARIPSQSANSVQIMKMCQAFASQGHEVDLYIPHYNSVSLDLAKVFSQYDVRPIFRIIYIPMLPSGSVSVSFCLGLLRLGLPKYDLLFARSVYASLLYSALGRSAILEIHSDVWRSGAVRQRLFPLMLKFGRPQMLVTISESLKQDFLASELGFPGTLLVAHDGADSVEFTRSPASHKKDGILRLCYVGSLNAGKGMEVIARLSHLLTDAEIHVVGGTDDQVQKWRLNVAPQVVRFHGYVDQPTVSRFLLSADICLLPNQQSVFGYGASSSPSVDIGKYTSPLKLFQYMAHAKPIICSDLPVLREVVTEHFARFAAHDQPKEWLAAVEELREMKVRHELSKNALQEFENNYTWLKRAEKIIDAWEEGV